MPAPALLVFPQRTRSVAEGRDRKGIGGVGENRYHAILGNEGPAKFVSPSTIVPVLIAYGAMVRIEGPKGKRELPLEKFFIIPQTESEREHDLRPNEVVTEVLLPRRRVEGCALRNPPEGSVRLATSARRRRASR